MTGDGTSRAARWPALLYGALAAFQAALAGGAPWGAVAWGGAHPGVLPGGYRAASAVSAVVWAAVTVALVAPGLSRRSRRRLVTVLLPVMVLSAVMNAASPSPAERALWTPFAVVQLVLLWRLRRVLAPSDDFAGPSTSRTTGAAPVSSPRRGSSEP